MFFLRLQIFTEAAGLASGEALCVLVKNSCDPRALEFSKIPGIPGYGYFCVPGYPVPGTGYPVPVPGTRTRYQADPNYYIVPTEDHIKEMKSSRMWKDILKEPGYCAANEGIQALAQAVVAGRTDLASGNQKSNT